MDFREVLLCLIAFSCAFASTTADDKLLVLSDSEDRLNEHTAELIWISCRLELLNSKEVNFNDWNQTLSDCLRKKNLSVGKRRLLQNLIPAPSPIPLPSPSNSVEGSRKMNGHNRTIIISVVLTATLSFAAVGIVFCCYTKIMKKRQGNRLNDQTPLFGMSMTEYSDGTAFKPNGSGNYFSSGKNDSASYVHSDKQEMKPLEVVVDNVHNMSTQNLSSSPLKLPPGRPVMPLPGMVNSAPPPAPPPKAAGPSPPPKPPQGMMNSAAPPPAPPPKAAGPPTPPKPPPGMVNSAAPPPPTPPPKPAGSPPPPKPPPGMVNSASAPPPPAPPLKAAGPPPPMPPLPPKPTIGNRPPGPPTGPRPPLPPSNSPAPPRPPGPPGARPPRGAGPGKDSQGGQGPSTSTESDDANSKTKLKPFFWDKVLANPDQSMVWHDLKAGSFQFNEEAIESLFGYTSAPQKKDNKKDGIESQPQYIHIIEAKKSQNLSILLRAWNVTTEEIYDALIEGNELPSELLQTLLKMAPTSDEERKLKLYNGDLARLGPADRFLKLLVDIPFAYKRMESLLFMVTLQEESSMVKDAFTILEAACTELTKSRLFHKLLEAVLKTGNRMNDGTFRGGAQAFKLDTLLKLSDVKGKDGKTTLLHFVVEEIIKSEGIRSSQATKQAIPETSNPDDHYRALGLQVVSRLSVDLENVKRAAGLDSDGLTRSVIKLGLELGKVMEFVKLDTKGSGFMMAVESFVGDAEVEVAGLVEEEKRIMGVVKKTVDYFHGNNGKDEGLRLFGIVRDFLIILDKVCKEVGELNNKRIKENMAGVEKSSSPPPPPPPILPSVSDRLTQAIKGRRIDDDDDSED